MAQTIRFGPFVFAFGLSIAYWPQIYGPGTSPRWAYLAVTLPIMLLLHYRTVPFTIAHLLGLLFVSYAAISLTFTSSYLDGIDSLIKLGIVAEAFVLGTYLTSLRSIFQGLAIGLGYSSILVLCDLDRTGLFVNINILAEIAALCIVGLCVYRDWFYIPLLLPSLLANNSRGAILALAIVSCLYLLRKSKLLAFSFFALVLFLGSMSVLTEQHIWKITSLSEHWTLWADTVSGLSFFGHGAGSFFTSYPFHTNTIDVLIDRPRYAHNDYLQLLFEYGFVGTSFLLAFLVFVLKTKEQEKYVLYGFLTISCFSFPSYLPCSSFIAAIVCGYLVRDRLNIFDPATYRGISLLPWYAVDASRR